VPRQVLWQGKPLQAFWSVGTALSLLLNVILLVTLLIVGRQMFAIKSVLEDHLLAGLYYNFILMDQADIVAMVQVEEDVPVEFDLRVQKETTVVLTAPTTINNAQVSLSTGGLNIVQAPTDIVLPAGTQLPIALDMVVPVSATIPITMNVPVAIPLSETDLHEPFMGLQEVVAPIYWLVAPLPDSWHDYWCRTPFGIGCK
jgi:hypothetical protein